MCVIRCSCQIVLAMVMQPAFLRYLSGNLGDVIGGSLCTQKANKQKLFLDIEGNQTCIPTVYL